MSEPSPAKKVPRWRRFLKAAAIALPFVLLALPAVAVTLRAMFSERARVRIAGTFVGGMAQNPSAIVIIALVGLAIAWLVITIICIRERWFPARNEGDQAAAGR